MTRDEAQEIVAKANKTGNAEEIRALCTGDSVLPILKAAVEAGEQLLPRMGPELAARHFRTQQMARTLGQLELLVKHLRDQCAAWRVCEEDV